MRFLKSVSFAALALLGATAMPESAQADFDVEVSIDGGAYQQVALDVTSNPDASIATTNYTISDGGASFTLTVESALGNNANPTSYSTSTTLGLTSNVTDSNSHTLSILVSDQNLTLPGQPRNLYAQADNLSNVAGIASASVQGFVDSNNGLNAISGAGVTSTNSASLTSLGLPPGSVSTNTVHVSGSSTYSLTGVLTLSTSSNINVSNIGFGAFVTTPEPGTLAILASGLPLLGLWKLRRRRSGKLVTG